jgi:hypothetical protein
MGSLVTEPDRSFLWSEGLAAVTKEESSSVGRSCELTDEALCRLHEENGDDTRRDDIVYVRWCDLRQAAAPRILPKVSAKGGMVSRPHCVNPSKVQCYYLRIQGAIKPCHWEYGTKLSRRGDSIRAPWMVSTG